MAIQALYLFLNKFLKVILGNFIFNNAKNFLNIGVNKLNIVKTIVINKSNGVILRFSK